MHVITSRDIAMKGAYAWPTESEVPDVYVSAEWYLHYPDPIICRLDKSSAFTGVCDHCNNPECSFRAPMQLLVIDNDRLLATIACYELECRHVDNISMSFCFIPYQFTYFMFCRDRFHPETLKFFISPHALAALKYFDVLDEARFI